MKEPDWTKMPGGGLVPFIYQPHVVEMSLWENAAIARDKEARRMGLQDKHGASSDPEAGLRLHKLGVWGEGAFARFQGMDQWQPTVNTFRSMPDVGAFEVRCRSRHDYDLLVRRNDRDGSAFILATCEDFRFVNVWGWIRGAEAKQKQFERTHGGREPAYFVPKWALHPLDLIPWRGVSA